MFNCITAIYIFKKKKKNRSIRAQHKEKYILDRVCVLAMNECDKVFLGLNTTHFTSFNSLAQRKNEGGTVMIMKSQIG